MLSIPDDVKDDILLSCRYGELEEVQSFVKNYGAGSLAEIYDENRNSTLHMASANGHADLLDFLLPLVPSELLAAQNDSGSTALHWASLNKQLEVARKLISHPNGPGRDLIDIKNHIGRSSLGEAEVAGWDEGAKLFVEMMNLAAESQEELIEDDEPLDDKKNSEAEVEIPDAEEGIAKISLSSAGLGEFTREAHGKIS